MHPRTFKTVEAAREHFNAIFMNYSIHDKVKPYDFTIKDLIITHEQGFAKDAFVLFGQYGDFFIIGETTVNSRGEPEVLQVFLDEAVLQGHADELPETIKAMLIAAVRSTIAPVELLKVIGKWRGMLDTPETTMEEFFMVEANAMMKTLTLAQEGATQ